MKIMKKIFSTLPMLRLLPPFLLAAAMVLLCGCRAGEPEELAMTEIYFDTVVQIRIQGGTPEMLETCKEMCSYYEGLLSKEIPTSEISRVNASPEVAVEVSPETAGLIRQGLYYGELSDGNFDVTIAPVSDLWNFHDTQNPSIPSKEARESARVLVNYKNVLIEGNEVTLLVPGMKLDLGGIAKGYIADRLKEYLVGEGVEHGYINLGGNVLLIGKKYDGSNYRIGIQRPFDKSGQAITSVEAADCSIVSSGIDQRYFEKDGKLYHHILNPETGMPFENDLLQVTVISDDSVSGDALSTCCFALGLEEGTKLIESLENVEAVFITKDYELHYAGKRKEQRVSLAKLSRQARPL